MNKRMICVGRVTGLGLLMAAVAVLCCASLAQEKAPPPENPQKAGAITVPAITFPSEDVEVASFVGGVISKVLVEEGDTVKKGQPLVQMDDEVARAGLAISKERATNTADVDKAAAKLEKATQDFERAKALREQGSMPEAKFEEYKLAYYSTTHDLNLAKTSLQLAKLTARRDEKSLDKLTIKAPTSGYIYRRHVDPGEAVEELRPVIQLTVLDPIDVVVYVPAETLGRISEGDTADFSAPSVLDKPYPCTIKTVDRMIDPTSGTCRVKLVLPNPDGAVAAGLQGSVTFRLKPRKAGKVKK